MAYKDKTKQRAAARERQRRYRRDKGVTEVTPKTEGVTGMPTVTDLNPMGLKAALAALPIDWVIRDETGFDKAGSTEGMTRPMTLAEVAVPTLEDGMTDLNPMGLPPDQMRHVAGAAKGHTINTGHYKTANELGPGEFNKVSLPGDADYDGVCPTVDALAHRWHTSAGFDK